MKRMRGRNHRPGGGGGSGGPIRHHNGQIPLNRNHVFDSNGPDLRIRGTAQQLFEKYLQLGRDATSSGDRVMAEGYFQHAEHYFRIVNAIAQAAQQNQAVQQNQGMQPSYVNNQQRGRMLDEQDGEDRGGEDPLISGGAPAPQSPPQQAAGPYQPPYQPASQPQHQQASDRRDDRQGDAPFQPGQERAVYDAPAAPAPPAARPVVETRARAPRQPRERRAAEPESKAPQDARPETELSGA